MIVLISPEHFCEKEVYWVNKLFENELDFFHIRKYHLSLDQTRNYLRQIDPVWMSRVVLHAHFELALEFGITNLHYNTSTRIASGNQLANTTMSYSTSVHSITEFNTLDNRWNYAFLSPVYPSVSKLGYGNDNTVLNSLYLKNNPEVSLVALGGVGPKNVTEVLGLGADGIALLGSVWQSENPLKKFLQCKKNDHLF